MKLLLFSDLHLDAPFVGLGPEVGERRRQAQRDTLINIVKLADEIKADALLCGGDLYEQESFSDDTMQFVRAAFGELTIPVFVAPGNHDWYGRTSMYERADWSQNVHVFDKPRLSPAALSDGLTLWGAAHLQPAGTPGFLGDGFHADGEGIHLALFHGSELGWYSAQGLGKDLHAPFDETQISESGLSHAFLGHYHRAKEAGSFTYPGNPCPLAFGEDQGRGAVVITVHSDGRIDREWRQVAAYAVHDLTIDVTGSSSQQDIRDRLLGELNGLTGCARVRLIGELGPDLAFNHLSSETLRGTLDGLVLLLDGLRIAYDFEAIAEEQTVRGQFVRDVMAEVLDDDERHRILVTGLRALGDREDLEVT